MNLWLQVKRTARCGPFWFLVALFLFYRVGNIQKHGGGNFSGSAGVLFPEMGTGHEAHDEDSGEEEDKGEVVRVVMKAADVEEDEADDEIQESPEGVDEGRGHSSAGRFGEGAGEWFSGDALDEVRYGVGEERSGEEGGEVGVPGHGGDFSKVCRIVHARGGCPAAAGILLPAQGGAI